MLSERAVPATMQMMQIVQQILFNTVRFMAFSLREWPLVPCSSTVNILPKGANVVPPVDHLVGLRREGGGRPLRMKKNSATSIRLRGFLPRRSGLLRQRLQ